MVIDTSQVEARGLKKRGRLENISVEIKGLEYWVVVYTGQVEARWLNRGKEVAKIRVRLCRNKYIKPDSFIQTTNLV